MVANDDLKPVFELTRGATPLWSDTVVSYNGETSGTEGVEPMKVHKDGNVLTFSGAHAEDTYTQDARSSQGRIVSEHIGLEHSQSEKMGRASTRGRGGEEGVIYDGHERI